MNTLPFKFSVQEGEELTLRGAVGQAIGAASMCWKRWPTIARGSEFDEESAREIVDALMAEIDKALQYRDERAIASQRELEKLDEWMRESFPRMEVKGTDPALDSVRRALEILNLVRTHVPTLIKMVWESVVRPSIHVLQSYGIDILPSGTIVYGAQPNTHVHKPE